MGGGKRAARDNGGKRTCRSGANSKEKEKVGKEEKGLAEAHQALSHPIRLQQDWQNRAPET